jgi:hypothetical protein
MYPILPVESVSGMAQMLGCLVTVVALVMGMFVVRQA